MQSGKGKTLANELERHHNGQNQLGRHPRKLHVDWLFGQPPGFEHQVEPDKLGTQSSTQDRQQSTRKFLP